MELLNEHKEEINPEGENAVKKIDFPKPPEFEYPENYKEKIIKDSDLPGSLAQMHDIIGQDSKRRYNLHFLNDKEILMANATVFQIVNIDTKERVIYNSTEVGGIGAVTVHPSQKYFAVGECGQFPNIYIYEYIFEPSNSKIKLYRILRKGTERAYSALIFNLKGDLLASVGSEPDYNLVIWNWRNETIILKAKAFSQEIFNVQFSANFEGKLITSGLGHIRFWEMARTFTGLKLQGELGKFGQVDLSDISAFVEFPDGKVLSGTEHGTFLLWEGIFIKANLKVSDTEKCHQGIIEYMAWDSNVPNPTPSEMKIMTGAHDGFIKWWDYLDFENVVLDDNSNGIVKPIKVQLLTNPISKAPIKIINLVRTPQYWLVQDGNGYLMKVIPTGEEIKYEKIIDFHSGPVVKVSFMAKSGILINQGCDMKVSLVNQNLISKGYAEKIVFEENIQTPHTLQNEKIALAIPKLHALTASCADIALRDSEEDPYIFAVGYTIGLFKIFELDPIKETLDLIFQDRPHESPIIKILFSPDKSYLCTACEKELFFFIVEEYDKVNPWCCIKKEGNLKIIDIDWHSYSKKILVGYSNGTLEEIEIPIHFDNSKSYLLPEYQKRTFTVKLADGQIEKEDEKKRRRKQEQGKAKVEPTPNSILSCKYIHLYKEDDFLVTSQKPFNDSLYLCTFDESSSNPERRPINFWKLPPKNDYYIKHISRNFVFISTQNGLVHIRSKKLLDKFVEISPNLQTMSITDITTSHDERLIAISFEDGSTLVYHLDVEGIYKYLEMLATDTLSETDIEKFNRREIIAAKYENPDIHTYLKGIKKINYISRPKKQDHPPDTDPLTILSLEKEKKDAQEREKLRIAEEKRQKMLAKIAKYKEEFGKVRDENNYLPEEIRLTSEEMIMDDNYLEIIKKEKQQNLREVDCKYAWLKANIEVTIRKIKQFYLSSVKTNKIYVFALRSNEYVSTLRCPELPPNFQEEMLSICNEIDDFKRKIDFESLEKVYKTYILSNIPDEKEEEQRIENLIQHANERAAHLIQKKKEDKDVIKIEIGDTKSDVQEIEDEIKSKIHIKSKVTEKEKSKKKHLKSLSNLNTKIEKCPDAYNLKMNYDRDYNEATMRTTFIHRRKMYNFLNVLFEEREKFNQSIFDLKRKKEDIIKTLTDKKKSLVDINTLLNKENETYDWFDFSNKDPLELIENEERIKEEDLGVYMKDKIVQDKELATIYTNANSSNQNINSNSMMLNTSDSNQSEWNFIVKERQNKKTHESTLDQELRTLQERKYEFKKMKILKECNTLIDSFDSELRILKSERTSMAFFQKLGELELFCNHEEYNKLRAFESEDILLIKKLEDLCNDYRDNLNNLKSLHENMEVHQAELDRAKETKRKREIDFDKLIENEREHRDKLLKCFRLRKKVDLNKDINDDKLDQEEELDLPKNLSTQLKTDILSFRDQREQNDLEIEKSTKALADCTKRRDTFNRNKEALDKRRFELREKIRKNEKAKERFLNQIEFSVPLKLNQFCRMDVPVVNNDYHLDNIHKIPFEMVKAVFITNQKMNKLRQNLQDIQRSNKEFESELAQFNLEFEQLEEEKKKNEGAYQTAFAEFKNEQILKFGLEIEFDFLLQATEDKTVDKYEAEYKKQKIESDRKIDEYKTKIDQAKEELQRQTRLNTAKLEDIRKELENNKINDQKLEEKNNEIYKKASKKFVLYNIKEKKDRLKEILKLLQQQMEALKKEIDIFRRKGGHIYSTIASNLI